MNEVPNPSSTYARAKNSLVPRGNRHNKTESKTTVSLYLDKNLVVRAKNRHLNLSRITEQALSSIQDYLGTQNSEISSEFLSTGCFQKESVVVPRAGFEPTTNGDITRKSPFFLFQNDDLENIQLL
jgi:hypothetical protein